MPLGVVASIVPWNYPFHNIFNPLLAAVFAGDALVIKASEHASWSVKFYQQLIDSALAAAGAPKGLVQILTGATSSFLFLQHALSIRSILTTALN